MFGRQGCPPINAIIGLPYLEDDVHKHVFTTETQASLQLAFEIAQRSLAERSNKQHGSN